MVSLKQTQTFHKKKADIPRIILRQTERHEIIYGARALNKRFPPHLRRATVDFDIFSKTPKRDALQTERALDKHMGFNAFKTRPAEHEGTFKVKSNVTGEGYADYTKPEERIPHKRIGRYNYVKLSAVKTNIKKTLKDPESKYRHDKDRDALNRIRIYEKSTRRKQSLKRKRVRIQKTRKLPNIFLRPKHARQNKIMRLI